MPIRPEYRRYYHSDEWTAARATVLKRSQGCCERCGRPNGSWLLSKGLVWLCPTWRRWRAPASILVDLRDPLERGSFVLAPCGRVDIVETQLGCAHIDNDPGNNDLANLAAWCRTCHLYGDREFHRRSRQIRKDMERPLFALQIPQIEPFG